MRTWIRDNGLSLVLFALFAMTMIGHAWSGWLANNDERALDHVDALALGAYLQSGAFLSSVFENWESEFLQMGVYVVLTAYLFQRGSPESKDPDQAAPQDRDPKLDENNPGAPWPVRAGGFVRTLYAHSLGLALALLFVASFALHAVNSARHANDEAFAAGAPPPGLLAHLGSAELWFESFQNWQSEFLSTAVLIVLAVFLRERGSPESKPVAAPHEKTGTD
jgi:hypothetical protein